MNTDMSDSEVHILSIVSFSLSLGSVEINFQNIFVYAVDIGNDGTFQPISQHSSVLHNSYNYTAIGMLN